MSPFERALLAASIALSGATGLTVWLMKRLLPRDPFAAAGGAWEPVILGLHVLAGPVVIFAIGLVSREHIVAHLREGVAYGRVSGSGSILFAAAAIATGYVLEVVTAEGPRGALVWVHLGSGLLFLASFAIHFVRGLRGRRLQAARRAAPRPVSS